MGRRKLNISKDELERLYITEGLSSSQIAVMFDVGDETIRRALIKHNIKRFPVGPPSGEKNPFWNGGRKVSRDGYVYILKSNHPFADRNGYVLEHRLKMEWFLGRYLEPQEIVHHKNSIRDDNRLDNLELLENHSKHIRIHFHNRDPITGRFVA